MQFEIWEALRDACRRANVQLFATTHSRGCALAAHRALSQSLEFDYELSAYRLERKGEKVRAVSLTRETLDTAADHDWEVR